MNDIDDDTFMRWVKMGAQSTYQGKDGWLYVGFPRKGDVPWSATLNEWWPGIDKKNQQLDALNEIYVMLAQEVL